MAYEGNLLWIDLETTVSRAVAKCGTDARKMHFQNGLFLDLDTHRFDARPLGEASKELRLWLLDRGCKGSPLCGSSVHFDRSFLNEHLSAAADELHHRNLDVRTMLECLRMWHGVEPPPCESPHRALSDVHLALANMRWAQEFIAGRGAR